jgi:hypothetical protein
MYSEILPIVTVLTAVKATCKYCGEVSGCHSNPQPGVFNYVIKF